MNKTNRIYLWRIVFTYIILVIHLDNVYHYVQDVGHGFTFTMYYAVDFFFIVSGYLLYQKLRGKSAPKDALTYSLSRLRRIYPPYLLVLLLSFVAVCVGKKTELSPFSLFMDSFWEIVMLQGIGLGREWNYLNPTLWFLSVMLIAGYVIYFCLQRWHDVFLKLVAPILMIIVASLLYRNVGSLDAVVVIDEPWLNYPLFRGFMDMMLGVYAWFLVEKIKHASRPVPCVFLGYFFTLSAIFLGCFQGAIQSDYMILALLYLGIVFSFVPAGSKVLESPLIKKWSKMTLYIYLIHDLFRSHIFPYFLPEVEGLANKMWVLLLFFVVVTVAAMVLEAVMRLLKKLLCSRTAISI